MSKLPNIIFLDMDGVLCNHRSSAAVGNEGITSYLDPIACLLVKRLCTEHNARIVISSAWRGMLVKHSMEAILNAACAGLGDLVLQDDKWWRTREWVTCDEKPDTSDRGREIEHWILNNSSRFNNFCILDAMCDMRPLQDSLVRCDVYDGIGFREYNKAKELLGAWP